LSTFPTSVVGGYVHNTNAVPLLATNFSYIGIIGTYNLFDFEKREHAIKERNEEVRMAQIALELTKTKVAAAAGTSYFELERSRQLSEIAYNLESATDLLGVKYNFDDPDIEAARAKIELEMLQLDFQHRQAYEKLRLVMGE
jgi:outer membrane protein TolC